MDSVNLTNKLNKIAPKSTSKWQEKAKWRETNESWLDKSAEIALKILRSMRANNMSQKELANILGVSAQYVNKIVKGKENLTLETICNIERVLKIELIVIPSFHMKTKLDKGAVTSPFRKERLRRTITAAFTKHYSTQQYDTYKPEEYSNSGMAA